MTGDEFNAFCGSLPAASHVVQWGDSDVWKVGGREDGKVFAICGWHYGDEPAFTFKISEMAFEMLKGEPGLRPAPYLASRGLKWIQHYALPGLDDDALRDYLRASHRLAAANLTKKRQRELGLMPDDAVPSRAER